MWNCSPTRHPGVGTRSSKPLISSRPGRENSWPKTPWNGSTSSSRPIASHGRIIPSWLRAPAIVLQGGVPILALGSAGSNLIPPIVTGVISNVVDRRMGVRDAVMAPRTLWGGHDPVQVQIEIAPPQTDADADGLLSMGFPDFHRLYFPPEAIPLARFGAVNAVAFDPHTGRFTGVGDVRRNGFAAGPRVGPTGPPSR